MLWYEIWYNKEFDTYALLVARMDGDGTVYTVDYGVQMWAKEYKRASAAVKYLTKGGYECAKSVITIGKNQTCPKIFNGQLVERS